MMSLLTNHVSTTHNGGYRLSLNWCGFLIAIPLKKNNSRNVSSLSNNEGLLYRVSQRPIKTKDNVRGADEDTD